MPSNKSKLKVYCRILLLLAGSAYVSAAGTFVSTPRSINEMITVCNGSQITLTCSHNNTDTGVTRWVFTNITDCESNTISHNPSIPDDLFCGPFTFSDISKLQQETLNSTATAIASSVLNGGVVQCLDSAGTTPNTIGRSSVSVIDPMDVPPPYNLTVMFSDGAVIISWGKLDEIFSYLVEITFGESTIIIPNGTIATRETSVTFQSLSSDQEYVVLVRTVVTGSCLSKPTRRTFMISGDGEFEGWKIAVIVIVFFTAAILGVMVIAVLCVRHLKNKGYYDLTRETLDLSQFSGQGQPDLKENWSKCEDLPTELEDVQCIIISGTLYVQGSNNSEDECLIYSYAVNDQTWNTLPESPPAKYCGLGNLDGTLIAVGGIKEFDNHKEVTNEVYSYINNKWKKKVPPMNLGRHSSCVMSFRSRLVVVGGKIKVDSNEYTNNVEIYIAGKKRWNRTIALAKNGQEEISTVVHGDLCYILGKQIFFASVDVLNSCAVPVKKHLPLDKMQSWQIIDSSPPTVFPRAAVLGGNLIAVGGQVNNGSSCDSNQIYKYDVDNRQWDHFLDLPNPLQGCGVAVLSNREFFVIGGCSGAEHCPRKTMYKFRLPME